MSKIQKALGRLRGEDRQVREAVKIAAAELSRAESSLSEATGDGNQRSYSGLRRRRYALPENHHDEVLPSVIIKLDMNALKASGLRVQDENLEHIAQMFRRIKRPILNIAFGELGAGTPNSNVVMVASALPKSGKTFCSYNLAVSIARERDIGAVLVDADVLKPSVSRALGIDSRIGLIDYLLDTDITLDDILVGTDLHDIVVVPAGQQHYEATELLASRRMEQFVEELSSRYPSRAIIVDTPPLLLTNEAHVLAEHMGQIVFVIESGVTSMESIHNALELLNRNKPINAVFNKARSSSGIGYGSNYGGSYYGYYQTPTDRQKPE